MQFNKALIKMEAAMLSNLWKELCRGPVGRSTGRSYVDNLLWQPYMPHSQVEIVTNTLKIKRSIQKRSFFAFTCTWEQVPSVAVLLFVEHSSAAVEVPVVWLKPSNIKNSIKLLFWYNTWFYYPKLCFLKNKAKVPETFCFSGETKWHSRKKKSLK